MKCVGQVLSAVCKVLRDGIPEAEKAAIKAGKLQVDDDTREARRCCADKEINGRGYSQCCL
ncbi:hypothetical protein MNEG_6293 [Monoraphidium neglectum]|uniref:Uncharacterized protein n=1 Tax=Monoraphidium neglectum TaxID=145388 RepID=A0A0D2L368_9CHLO|nr:hypothetical protein MNEG_6293 [Monoraphidium neglectum]KIZ01669.1 hypothetical protein MNEG_6293 [Monoraphidium neglectum]|eukprot:XP_013900688.1 hypothetical protein MNEG_6293 [Monoraphidium neglectum]